MASLVGLAGVIQEQARASEIRATNVPIGPNVGGKCECQRACAKRRSGSFRYAEIRVESPCADLPDHPVLLQEVNGSSTRWLANAFSRRTGSQFAIAVAPHGPTRTVSASREIVTGERYIPDKGKGTALRRSGVEGMLLDWGLGCCRQNSESSNQTQTDIGKERPPFDLSETRPQGSFLP